MKTHATGIDDTGRKTREAPIRRLLMVADTAVAEVGELPAECAA